jgi:hypothetical protein
MQIPHHMSCIQRCVSSVENLLTRLLACGEATDPTQNPHPSGKSERETRAAASYEPVQLLTRTTGTHGYRGARWSLVPHS